MGIEETKQLLRTYRITPNKLLGQNFMVESSFYPNLCAYASLSQSDVVLDAGAGFGFLTCFLADKCKAVIAVEKDPQVAKVLREQVHELSNVTVIEGDMLKTALPVFNKTIAIPPYYLSSKLVLWLVERKVECAVLIVQKEFADRLVAKVGSEDYSWLTVTICQKAQVELLDAVSKDMFYPQPEVDSVIVRLKPWATVPFNVKDEEFFKRMVKWLFTERNKKLSNALEPFIKSTLKLSKQDYRKIIHASPYADMRVRELLPENFGVLANAFSN
jgi:16S rRNA (adenine1518-N6/adenine1519-N6)-dimethyltransferase